MYYLSGLEDLVVSFYGSTSNSRINYFTRNVDDNYDFARESAVIVREYKGIKTSNLYSDQQYLITYQTNHSFAPEFLLNASRPKTRFVDDSNEAEAITREVFELMMNERMPENISINILPFEEFKLLHSRFGAWRNGIAGFSLNDNKKKIFVRENHLDALMIVIGHEIGHVLTPTLPNKHDEEAKAFSFSIEWAKTIKKHNIANLGLSIKDKIDLQPARNGLHDIAFAFVDLMMRRGRKAIELHRDLAKKYVSIFDRIYSF